MKPTDDLETGVGVSGSLRDSLPRQKTPLPWSPVLFDRFGKDLFETFTYTAVHIGTYSHPFPFGILRAAAIFSQSFELIGLVVVGSAVLGWLF